MQLMADQLDALLRENHAQIVKSNRQRTVYRVHFAGEDWHVKRCRVDNWRAWWRERLRPAKAKLEFTKLHEALRRNVRTILPVGYLLRDKESILVTRTIPDATPLDQWLERHPGIDARQRISLASELGRTLATIHNAGVLHPDLHPGNLLVRWFDGRPELILLDLHDARIGTALTARQRIANLVLLNRWFVLRSSRADRLRCWRAYVAQAGAIEYHDSRLIERLTRISNARLWRSRSTRCLDNNRRFRRVAARGVAGHAVVEWQESELAPVLRQPEALFDPSIGPFLKDSRSSTVAVRTLTIGGVEQRVLCKRFRSRSLGEVIASIFRPTAAMRSWINGHGLRDALLPTPRPLLVLHRRRFGLDFDGFLITEFIDNAVDLRSALQDPQSLRDHIDRVARIVRCLHERGWSHRDLKAPNILLKDDSPTLIDLAGVARFRALTVVRRVKDLTRLYASFHDDPRLRRSDMIRFLRIYFNWNLHEKGDWKSWWRQIASRALGKVVKNRRRGRPLA